MSDSYTTWYLEMTSPCQARPKCLPVGLTIVECEIPQPVFNRFLYSLVEQRWEWADLDDWTDEQWKAIVESDAHRTWVAYFRGAIAGYYELYRPDGTNTEIRYFGLAEGFMGQGFGGALLSDAIAQAWRWTGTQRVWVHTCSYDHPAALSNYRARGLQIYRTEQTPLG